MSEGPVMRAIRQQAAAIHAAQQALVEAACEKALQGGRCGVLVVYNGCRLVSAEPDERVPYGHIYQMPEER